MMFAQTFMWDSWPLCAVVFSLSTACNYKDWKAKIKQEKNKPIAFSIVCSKTLVFLNIFFEWKLKNKNTLTKTRTHLPPASIDFLFGMFDTHTLRAAVSYSVNVTIQNRNGWKADVWQNKYVRIFVCLWTTQTYTLYKTKIRKSICIRIGFEESSKIIH